MTAQTFILSALIALIALFSFARCEHASDVLPINAASDAGAKKAATTGPVIFDIRDYDGNTPIQPRLFVNFWYFSNSQPDAELHKPDRKPDATAYIMKANYKGNSDWSKTLKLGVRIFAEFDALDAQSQNYKFRYLEIPAQEAGTVNTYTVGFDAFRARF